jgi:transposase InsO family protein
MASAPPLLSLLLMVVSGWVHRHQLTLIDFLQAENRLLKEKLGGKRLRFTDAERALLARKAKVVGRKSLLELDTIVSPDTLLRWHRQLVAQKWNFVHRRGPGRPRIMGEISELIVRMARENSGWGYTRIQGALANLNHRVGRGTIANVLKRSGIEPAPERGKRTQWSTFLKAHWKVLFAADFLTVEVWTGRGLITHYVLFVIGLADRVIRMVAITARPDEAWMLQVGRNLTDCGVLRSKQYLIIDRDSKYTAQFRRLIRNNGAAVIRLPPRSPNLNAHAERFVRSIKDECLNRMIFIGQRSLRRAVREYIEHYHEERNHQALGNRLIRPRYAMAATNGCVRCKERLGGTLNFYYREAA